MQQKIKKLNEEITRTQMGLNQLDSDLEQRYLEKDQIKNILK
jgi:hypothetical protein